MSFAEHSREVELLETAYLMTCHKQCSTQSSHSNINTLIKSRITKIGFKLFAMSGSGLAASMHDSHIHASRNKMTDIIFNKTT